MKCALWAGAGSSLQCSQGSLQQCLHWSVDCILSLELNPNGCGRQCGLEGITRESWYETFQHWTLCPPTQLFSPWHTWQWFSHQRQRRRYWSVKSKWTSRTIKPSLWKRNELHKKCSKCEISGRVERGEWGPERPIESLYFPQWTNFARASLTPRGSLSLTS